ncbi:endonuclease domain-containing protein [Pedobacter endophyticus]|uniref:Endonuclease domain-containing protein n=1 Tax=Pedobacter endophyticus TaxID=2789740 RepID=A0A7S9KZ18_9SPHI|nr:endonuclease domain-containing protein [Pedobacter endophyticus]QPH39497.1 endonuclease domain-containing protein [Pedobacter endophyticus]
MEKYGDGLFKGASHKLFEFSRVLRKGSTDAEDILWQALRRKQLDGFKFRRQHPVNKYIADFYCHDAKLIIEVDGEIHNQVENKECDQGRTYELEELGITVIRFTNEHVNTDLNAVLNEIRSYFQK